MADEAAQQEAAELPPNQGATATRPLGETPLTVGSEADAFAEHPEMFVGAAFAGGFTLAMILRRFARR
ncbi:MAG TPA: hypothetical protein VK307_06975 [Thermoleophilaceae bacterium]|nr:hypothetical protein [Thermoleophilaceae bacterium]